MSQLFLAFVWIQVSADTSVMLHDSSKRPHYRIEHGIEKYMEEQEKVLFAGCETDDATADGVRGVMGQQQERKEKKSLRFSAIITGAS